MTSRFVRLLVVLVVCLGARALAQSKSIAEAANRIAADLEKGPRLKLPPPSPEEEAVAAPESIRAAGEEFVAMWKLHHRFLLAVAGARKKPTESAPIQAAAGKKADLSLDSLIKRTIEDNPPPALEEYSAVFEDLRPPSDSDCGESGEEVIRLHDSLLALRNLRTGDYLAGYWDLPAKAADSILRVYGIDPEDADIGLWLHGNHNVDLRRHGKEKTASILLKWAEMRWSQLGKNALIDSNSDSKQPAFPDRMLISSLRSDNGVSDETKGKISQFLSTTGLQIHPVEYWLEEMPEGSHPWMVPLARIGLGHQLNRVKQRASAILTKAGVPHDPPPLKQAAKFRLTINGSAFPQELSSPPGFPSEFTVSLSSKSGTIREATVIGAGQGVVELNADSLSGPEPQSATIRYRDGTRFPTPPGEPFLKAEITLPIRSGETGNIDFKAVRVTIRPVLPAGRAKTGALMEIEFGPASEGGTPKGRPYHLKGAEELVLPYVCPGDYWLQIRHPGAVLMPWAKVKIGAEDALLTPTLKAGSTLVVPVSPHNPEALKTCPPELAHSLQLERGHMDQLVELWKDGKPFDGQGPDPHRIDEQFPQSAIFANLPPGNYELRLWTRNFGSASNPVYLIEPKSAKVIVKPDSPTYLRSEPMEIKLNPMTEKDRDK